MLFAVLDAGPDLPTPPCWSWLEAGSGGLAATKPTASPSARTGRGIGPTPKRALLRHFGAATKAVSRASVEDLVAVDGISRQMAQLIYDHFHEQAS